MAPEEPKSKVNITALPTLERYACLFRKRPKVEALLPPPPPKLEGCREVVCRKCHQPRMVPVKPAPSAGQIAAKLAKKLMRAEIVRRAQESIVAAEAFMRRHSVGDTVTCRAHSRPPNSC